MGEWVIDVYYVKGEFFFDDEVWDEIVDWDGDDSYLGDEGSGEDLGGCLWEVFGCCCEV